MKNKILVYSILGVVAFLIIQIPSVSATTSTLHAVQDTFIGIKNDGSGDQPITDKNIAGDLVSNLVLETSFGCGPFKLSKCTIKTNANTLLKFDLTVLPKDIIINSAELKLFNTALQGSGKIKVSFLDNNGWDKSTTILPLGSSKLLAESPVSTGINSWNVTMLPISNNLITLAAEPVDGNFLATFDNANNQPTLTIDFTEQPTKSNDTTPPVINNIMLSNTTPNVGDSITITVNATDNVKVTNVTENGSALSITSNPNIWKGIIIAETGQNNIHVVASDAAGNQVTDNSASYTGSMPQQPPPILTNLTITSKNPDSPFNSTVGSPQTFTIETNQNSENMNVEWSLDNINVQTNSTTPAEYTNTDATVGQHVLTANVSNNNGTDSFSWNWNVENVTPPLPVVGNASIVGRLFNDPNGTGHFSTEDTGLRGWFVNIIGVIEGNTKVITSQTITDENGTYMFGNLAIGKYYISEQIQPGFIPVSAPFKTVKINKERKFKRDFFNKPIK